MALIMPCQSNGKNYYTIVNSENGFHVHANTKKQVMYLLSCIEDLKSNRGHRKYAYSTYLQALDFLYTGKPLVCPS